MPWKELSKMDRKKQFVLDYLSGVWSMTELCEGEEISRQTGYTLVKRYLEGGDEGLVERSRAPHTLVAGLRRRSRKPSSDCG